MEKQEKKLAAQEQTIKVKAADSDEPDEMETKDNDIKNDASDSGHPDSKNDPPEDESSCECDDIETALEKAEEEAKENFNRFLRVSAEFENYKKRTTREMTEFRKYANESIIKELLPVLDNLERAIASSSEEKDAEVCIIEGVEMTHKEILKIFGKFNVMPVEAIGQPFDPNFHQAVMQEESDEYPENTVLRELQKGYLMHDRLIRPAMVVVSAPKEK